MSELADCPICGEAMLRYDPPTEPVVWCSEPDCRYSATTVEAHNTLARRAEAGRLVERLIDGRCLSVEDSGGDWITASLVQIVDGREVELGEVQGEVGLLAALERLLEPLPVDEVEG